MHLGYAMLEPGSYEPFPHNLRRIISQDVFHQQMATAGYYDAHEVPTEGTITDGSALHAVVAQRLGSFDPAFLAERWENDFTPAELTEYITAGMASGSAVVALSRAFAVEHHGSQLYGERPYWVHLESVASVLERFAVATPTLVAAAWLHDVLEDTKATSAALRRRGIPQTVIATVECVTAPSGSRQQRNAAVYPKIAGKLEPTTLKLADRIANVEAGTVEMYAKEHAAFRGALYDPQHNLEPMWQHLDAMLATQQVAPCPPPAAARRTSRGR